MAGAIEDPKTSSGLPVTNEVFSWGGGGGALEKSGWGKPWFCMLSLGGFGASLRPPRDDGGGVAIWVFLCAEGDLTAVPEVLALRDFLAERWPCCCCCSCDTFGVTFDDAAAASLCDKSSGPEEEGRRRAEPTGPTVADLAVTWCAWVAKSRTIPSADRARFLPIDGGTGLSGAKSRLIAPLPEEVPFRFPGVELKTE